MIRQRTRSPAGGSDQPQTYGLGSFLSVEHVNGDALTLRETHNPRALLRRGPACEQRGGSAANGGGRD
jgi:hypothetical protein